MKASASASASASALLVAALLALSAAAAITSVSASEELNIHVIAHTHDDVGWLKTVDEYYYGANSSIQDAGVQYILDSVIPALESNPLRKFIYVEIAFFARWWREQDAAMQQRVRNLINSGQFSFVNGGWCMSDEANVHYAAVVDQMELGHKFLWETFQVKPNVGWHIDPFGHASTTPSLFARMGFEALFFARIDYQDYILRNKTKNLELVWRGSQSLGAETDMFTHSMYDGTYCYPGGFAFEWANSPPIQDDERLYDVNIQQRADAFAEEMRGRTLSYKSPNILVTFGCDFQYQNANVNFKNMDKLMKYMNARKGTYNMNVFYSTPIEYVNAVHSWSEKNQVAFELKTDDFFPYADNQASYWTGYFTSRPALKGYVRSRANVLHSGMRLFTTARASLKMIDSQPDKASADNLERMWEAFSVTQHHDAVAGTSQQHVAYDYAARLALGTSLAEKVMSKYVGSLAAKKATSEAAAAPAYAFCEYLNVSVCDPLTATLKLGVSVPVTFYNNLAQERNEYARLPVPTGIPVKVLGPTGAPVVSQSFPDPLVAGVTTLVFLVEKVPAMGFVTYFVAPTSSEDPERSESSTLYHSGGVEADDSIENEYYKITVDATTGRWSTVTNKKLSQNLVVDQDYQWYNGSCGRCCHNSFPQASGAYIFRPNRTDTFPIGAGTAKTTYIKGGLLNEAYSVWSDWVISSARLYKGQNYVEVTAKIGEIPIDDHLGKEVVVKYTTPLQSKKQWWTDSEGQEMQLRIRDYRPTWNYTVEEPVAGNYYPMNTGAYIRGSNTTGVQTLQLTLVTDRSKGVSSMKDGQLENMHHRRLLWDDGRGVGEPLNETEAIITTEFLTVDQQGGPSAVLMRDLQLRINNPLLPMFSTTTSVPSWISQYATTWGSMKKALPANVHLLTLRTQDNGQILIRLSHVFQVGEDQNMAQPAVVDLRNVLQNVNVVEAQELALTANQPVDEIKRLKWYIVGEKHKNFEVRAPEDEFVVTMRPMEIRTFMLTVQQA